MKLKKLMVIALSFMVLSLYTMCDHQHDDTCGYQPKTDSGCLYESVIMPIWVEDPPI